MKYTFYVCICSLFHEPSRYSFIFSPRITSCRNDSADVNYARWFVSATLECDRCYQAFIYIDLILKVR